MDTSYSRIPLGRTAYNTFGEIRELVDAKQKVYIAIASGKFKGSIAYIKSYPGVTNSYVQLRWDGRRNVTSISLYCNKCDYLKGYEGPTIWNKAIPGSPVGTIVDMRNNILAVNDTVVYIGGNPATLSYGIVRKIGAIMQYGRYTNAVKINDMKTNKTRYVKYPSRNMLKVSGTELEHDALIAKLEG